MYDKLYEYIENFLSQLLCGFRTAISPIPTFTGDFVGTILVGFSKACDCLLMIYITLKRSICSGVCFQYSCEWYIEQIKLLKLYIEQINPQEI